MGATRLLVTGSSGLIGSSVCDHFLKAGWEVCGVDNNMRAQFFGAQGDTRWNQRRMEQLYDAFAHHELDVRDRQGVLDLVRLIRPHVTVHAAAQPSHDLAARIPFDDFDVNAVGTLNLLEAARRYVPDSPFVFMSTNKVYGDAPNELPLTELEKRWDYADKESVAGVNETCRTDRTTHSLFGASKLAADVLVQEYGRYFEMPTCCLRGGCLTGPAHAGVELHGFLSYLVRCNVQGRKYTIFGHKGKQVRDNIHAHDVARFIHYFVEAPRCGEVYNIGGGRSNSCSILEAFELAADRTGRKMIHEYTEEPRRGDHICYITDLSKARAHYSQWNVEATLDQLFDEIVEAWNERLSSNQ